jgi:hypothetical protein
MGGRVPLNLEWRTAAESLNCRMANRSAYDDGGSAVLGSNLMIIELVLITTLVADDSPKKEQDPSPNRVVLWNTHNGPEGNCGTKTAHVYLLACSGKVLWKKEGIEVPWHEKEDRKLEIPFEIGKKIRIDRIKVEVTAWHQQAGGLSEIQLYRNGDLVSADCFASASGEVSKGDRRNAQTLTDGVTTSEREYHGYCLLPLGKKGWFEVDLTRDRSGEKKSAK